MFPLYNTIQSRMPYLMHFKMKFISRYLFGCNTLKSALILAKPGIIKKTRSLLLHSLEFLLCFFTLLKSLFWWSFVLSLICSGDRCCSSLPHLGGNSSVILALRSTGMMRHFLCSQSMHKDSPCMCSLMDLLRLFSFPSCFPKGSTTNHFHPSCRNVLILGAHKFPVFHS